MGGLEYPKETEEQEPQSRQLSTCRAVPYLSVQAAEALCCLCMGQEHVQPGSSSSKHTDLTARQARPTSVASLTHGQGQISGSYPKKEMNTSCNTCGTHIPSRDNKRYAALNSINRLGCSLSARCLIIIQVLTED